MTLIAFPATAPSPPRAGGRHARGPPAARRDPAEPGGVPRAGRRPPGHPGHPPAARRRETPVGPLPQAGRGPAQARSCSSRPSTAGPGRAGRSSACAAPAALTERDGGPCGSALRRSGCRPAATRWHVLRAETLAALHTEPLAGLPPLTGGMVGYLGYDIVRRLERIGCRGSPRTTCTIPELVMLLATDLAVLDHHEGTVTLIANAINWDGTRRTGGRGLRRRRRPARRDDGRAGRARRRCRRRVFAAAEPGCTRRRTPAEHYRRGRGRQGADPGRRGLPDRGLAAVRRATCRGRRRWTSTGCCGPPTRARTCTCCGCPAATATPVSTSSAPSRRRWSRCADGARRRCTRSPAPGRAGATEEDDALLAKDLLADAKERAEHVMLVDLGRNDLGRVCAPGTREGASTSSPSSATAT